MQKINFKELEDKTIEELKCLETFNTAFKEFLKGGKNDEK